MSQDAAKVMARDLEDYPEAQIYGALKRCRHELRGRLTLADILTRLDDGHPSVEEAWALAPRDEYRTVVWTDEMAEAWGVAKPLLASDEIAARMVFKEVYTRLLLQARTAHRPPQWRPSLGLDLMGREGPLREAVEKKRLSATVAAQFLPPDSPMTNGRRLTATTVSSLLPRIAALEQLKKVRTALVSPAIVCAPPTNLSAKTSEIADG